jgi:DNA-binding NtrC family response regulator
MKLQKLLIVDDEIEILEAFAFLLPEYNDHIIFVSSGNQAIEKLKTHPVGFIISDYIMVDGNGEKILNYVLSQDLKIDFYFFTASNVDKFLNAGKIAGYFVKPSDFNKILKKIQGYFNE